MLSKKVEAALNKQINHELFNALQYKAMRAWFEHETFKGFGSWMDKQHEDELGHANRFFDYVNDRGGKVVLEAIDGPETEFKGPLDAFSKAYKLECGTTASIHDIYTLAAAEKDYATMSMLKWFIDEQVEEEQITSEAVALLEKAGDSKGAMLVLDHQFGKRGEKEGD